jgi:hypothetical protein
MRLSSWQSALYSGLRQVRVRPRHKERISPAKTNAFFSTMFYASLKYSQYFSLQAAQHHYLHSWRRGMVVCHSKFHRIRLAVPPPPLHSSCCHQNSINGFLLPNHFQDWRRHEPKGDDFHQLVWIKRSGRYCFSSTLECRSIRT